MSRDEDRLAYRLLYETTAPSREAAAVFAELEPLDAPHCASCGTTSNVSVVDGFPPTCWDCYELAVMRLAAAVDV